MAEVTLVNRILKDLRFHGAVAEKIHGGPYQAAGLSDILGCWPVNYADPKVCSGDDGIVGRSAGLFLAIECKDGAKRSGKDAEPTPIQQYFLDRVKACGGLAYTVRTKAEWSAVLIELLEIRRNF